MNPLSRELDVARRIAREAGRLILDVYATDFSVQDKGGGDPLTLADTRANTHLVGALRDAFPDDGIVAEESPTDGAARGKRRCWFIDPLDGTREFVKKNGEFAVHVGLAVDGAAALGVVYRPVGDRLYAGVVGEGCELEHEGKTRRLAVSDRAEPAALRVVVSRSNRAKRTAGALTEIGIHDVRMVGSVGVKAGLVAEGEADVYVHFSPKSSRWDACAPEAVLRAAGGRFTDLFGAPIRYDGSELMNARGLLGTNAAAYERILAVTSKVGPGE